MEADAWADGRKGAALTDTIFALSSGAPPAAVALIRISGPKADAALAALAGRLPEPRVATFRRLRADGEVLDNTVILRFPGPNSATGEDITELHLHGGRAVVASALAALGRMDGLRPAEPGEFTRRAFENGRIDLAEAEGLADLLEAETESQRRAALALAGGALSRQIGAWQERLLALAAQIEAALDFSDEDDVAPLPVDFLGQVRTIRDEFAAALARPRAERLKDGVRVAIAGPPNAGKSSLLNALVGRDAAITSPIPGTTRDLIEAPTAIGGVPFLLVDTAGMRLSSDEVETIGVRRAMSSVVMADIVVWLGRPESAPERSIVVHAKSDLGPPSWPCDLSLSALTGEGLDGLLAELIERSTSLLPGRGDVALNQRHYDCLREANNALREVDETADLLIAAEWLRWTRNVLDRVTGKAGVEDMLDALFGRFCIGK
ncbi:MAG TPA: tRNA uridine-5-carboxymethylaminomethyl(34) synthesis GTPase MnmE [Allosphingosinicella sp.]|nr:tRNA uridine-5-carboxymethylaminomethyl(34) synthesis GTPase MnmE [Allosphingosinicella sp.]